jgi:hypothetical protein
MDWKKSKTILIIALIITNLILSIILLVSYSNTRDLSLSKYSIANTKDILANFEIEIDCKIPKKHPRLSSLLVEFESYDEQSLNRRFFDSLGIITHPSTDRIEINYNNEHINLFNYRRIFYENSAKVKIYDVDSLKKAQKICENFMLNNNYNIDDMELSYSYFDDGKYYLNYSKIFEKNSLESSYTNFVIDNRGVVSMDRLWLNVLKKSKAKFRLSSAPRALLALIDKEESYGKIVKRIVPCYYFNPEDQGYIEDITKALQGRAIPAWKIEFSDGDNIVIDTF